jgi:DNA-directed RNA polymerase subunit beta
MLCNGNEGISTIPGFSQIQFKGFRRFINQGLAEELEKFPTIKDPDHKTAFQLFAKGYQLLEPSIKERDALYESLTYSSELCTHHTRKRPSTGPRTTHGPQGFR